MAHAILFDTLKYTETLMDAGVNAKQAKAQASALVELHQAAGLATKSDLEKLEIRSDARFTCVDTKLSAITWVLGMVAAGVVTLLIKAFL